MHNSYAFMNECNLLNTVRKEWDYAINAVLIRKTKGRVAGKINFDDLLIAFFKRCANC